MEARTYISKLLLYKEISVNKHTPKALKIPTRLTLTKSESCTGLIYLYSNICNIPYVSSCSQNFAKKKELLNNVPVTTYI